MTTLKQRRLRGKRAWRNHQIAVQTEANFKLAAQRKGGADTAVKTIVDRALRAFKNHDDQAAFALREAADAIRKDALDTFLKVVRA